MSLMKGKGPQVSMCLHFSSHDNAYIERWSQAHPQANQAKDFSLFYFSEMQQQ